ncbi:MAG: serine/threonine protein kinase [Victivallaceae bacterium]|nr:serine/threonine protein kinase [Victivallaceae bacterium]
MSESGDDKKQDKPGKTARLEFNAADVETTQKIKVDHEKVVDESSKKRHSDSGKPSGRTDASGSFTGKSFFNRKRVADDYVRSSTVLSTIGSIPPLEDNLELQSVYSNYELKHQFSEGAQGVIRSAFDKSLKRDIVVKSLKPGDSEGHSREDENLFVAEARIMAQLDHPSIIPLYGLHSGTEHKLHLAMKHIHGKTLQKYLQDTIALYERDGINNFDEKRSMATRIEYLIKVCEAVDYAHRKGVIHRDLKPENIMIGNYGEVYVMDWGLACLVDPEKFSDDEHLTEVGKRSKNALVGTPCYIAPELIRGGECSPQSDIFSLGMILFELVTLKRAVPGDSVNEVLKNIINWNYRSFRHRFLKGKLPHDLKSIIAKAICEPPSRRYKTANDMAEDLRLYLLSEETVARPDNIFRKCIRTMLNHKLTTSVVILSVLLGLAAVTSYSLYSQNQLMRNQKVREDMLAYFHNGVAQQAHRMERVFFYFNTQLAGIAYQAARILERRPETNIKVYTLADFRGTSPPPDYAYSPAYGIDISLDYPVFKKAPGEKGFDKLDKRVIGLTPLFEHVMFTSDPQFKRKTLKAVKTIIMEKGAPLNWITLGVENGTMFAYPGTSCYPDDYDPRTRPWYKRALNPKNNNVWSEPFRCALSSKILMSTTTGVYDRNRVFLGVAGLHIRLEYIQKYIFGNQSSGIREYLINREGKIILSSGFENEKAETNRKSTELILKEFPFAEAFKAAVKQHKGHFEAVGYNTKYLFALNRLPSLGYYYIQQISEKMLEKSWNESVSGRK